MEGLPSIGATATAALSIMDGAEATVARRAASFAMAGSSPVTV